MPKRAEKPADPRAKRRVVAVVLPALWSELVELRPSGDAVSLFGGFEESVGSKLILAWDRSSALEPRAPKLRV